MVYLDDVKVGHYRFCKNEVGIYEIDDIYIFSQFQNKGVGTEVINKCLSSMNESVMLYVFIKNTRAISFYKRLGFKVKKNIKNSRYTMIYNK